MATSAEPGRKAAYSSDLRWRIIWQRYGMELSFRKAAENLSISLGTTYNIRQLFEEKGCFGQKCTSRENNKLFNEQQELWIMGIIVNNPSLYLGEMSKNFFSI